MEERLRVRLNALKTGTAAFHDREYPSYHASDCSRRLVDAA